eukprot:404720_1
MSISDVVFAQTAYKCGILTSVAMVSTISNLIVMKWIDQYLGVLIYPFDSVLNVLSLMLMTKYYDTTKYLSFNMLCCCCNYNVLFKCCKINITGQKKSVVSRSTSASSGSGTSTPKIDFVLSTTNGAFDIIKETKAVGLDYKTLKAIKMSDEKIIKTINELKNNKKGDNINDTRLPAKSITSAPSKTEMTLVTVTPSIQTVHSSEIQNDDNHITIVTTKKKISEEKTYEIHTPHNI